MAGDSQQYSSFRGECASAGIHVLDVTPRSFSHVPGIEVRLQERAAELAAMEKAPVAFPPPTAIPEEVEMHRVP